MSICGLIGGNGYLGSQFNLFNKTSNEVINVYNYNRSKNTFDSLKSNKVNTIINLGSPNEISSRDKTKSNNEILHDWCKNIDYIINKFRPNTIIHISTITVFDKSKKNVNEDTIFNSNDPYGIIHIKCIEYLRAISSAKGIKLLIIFPSNIYGSIKNDLIFRDSLILNKTISSAITKSQLNLKSKCNSYRDFLWVEDFLEILSNIILYCNEIKYEKLIISSGQSIKIKKAIEILFYGLRKNVNQKIFYGNIDDVSSKVIYENLLIKKIFNFWEPKKLNSALNSLQKIYS
jgi:nucleoside-diphosphate-sugar epimerase